MKKFKSKRKSRIHKIKKNLGKIGKDIIQLFNSNSSDF